MITANELNLVERALRQAIYSDIELLFSASAHVIRSGGKRLRPTLVLLSYKAVGGKDISQAVKPKSFDDSKRVAKQGGNVAKVARLELEAKTGKKVVTRLNAKTVLQLNEGKKKPQTKPASKKSKPSPKSKKS